MRAGVITRAAESVYQEAEENQFREYGSCCNPITSRNVVCTQVPLGVMSLEENSWVNPFVHACVWGSCFRLKGIDTTLCLTSVVCSMQVWEMLNLSFGDCIWNPSVDLLSKRYKITCNSLLIPLQHCNWTALPKINLHTTALRRRRGGLANVSRSP